MNPQSEAGPRVALICNDTVLAERSRLAVDRDTDWRLSIVRSVPELQDTCLDIALAIVPVELLLEVSTDGPLLGYGPAARIRAAFLLGACDYLRTPFGPDELILRGELALCRNQIATDQGTLSFDRQSARLGRRSVRLSVGEYEILRLIARSEDRVVERASIGAVLGHPAAGSRGVDMHVSRLRKKLSQLSGELRIASVRGVGYRLGDR